MPSASDQRVIDVFIGQFTPDGEGYIYRRAQKGQAIRVSAAEYQGFVDDYVRAYRSDQMEPGRGCTDCAHRTRRHGDSPWRGCRRRGGDRQPGGRHGRRDRALPWLFSRDFNRPARTLDRRTPVGDALSNDAFLRRYFTEMSWAALLVQIGSLAAISLLVVLKHDASSMAGGDYGSSCPGLPHRRDPQCMAQMALHRSNALTVTPPGR